MSDHTGTAPDGLFAQFLTSFWLYIGFTLAAAFDKDIRDDMKAIGWNPFNSDASIASDSKKVSFYKGVPVVNINWGF